MANANEKLINTKINGRVYTPEFIVENILDLCEYNNKTILGKHIIDNSCGDGAFLCEVVRRYCTIAQMENFTSSKIREDLEKYIHGIEIDRNECKKCIKNLNAIAKNYNLGEIAWDINCEDTLSVDKYDGKMDFVVGNPPYVRVHNLQGSYEAVKKYSFAQSGMTDLFIVFYEIGLKMLNINGFLGYISPSSLFNSLAAMDMRKHLFVNRNIKTVVDLKHFQPFTATTYTTIMVLTATENNSISYYEYDGQNKRPTFVSMLDYKAFYIKGSFIFGENKTLKTQKEIMNFAISSPKIEVKNGFATLFDKFFIGDFLFKDYTIPIVKASTGRKYRCLFPYDKQGKILKFEDLAGNLEIRKHYDIYADQLKNRSLDRNGAWYGFGRSQGINDVGKKKYAINSLVRNLADIKLQECGPGVGVYSGLYILTNLSLEILQTLLFSDDFINYVIMLGKYKSGGYYTYSSKDLSRYLNWKYMEIYGDDYEQYRISEHN